MLEFLIENMFVEFGEHISQHIIDIPMWTNCVPLLAHLFIKTQSLVLILNFKHTAIFNNKARFWNNRRQVRSKSKGWKAK